MMSIKNPKLKYFLSALVSILGLWLHSIFTPELKLLPFILAYPLIYSISALWGLRSAMISIAVWTLGLSFFYFEPLYTFHVVDYVELVHLVIFAAGASSVTWLVAEARKKELKQNGELRHSIQLEAESKAKATKLEHENQLKDEFVNTLSHDLRNPLTVAKMSVAMLLQHPSELEQVYKLATKTMTSLERIDNMISDLLDSRRISAGNPLNMKFIKFDIVERLKVLKEDFTATYGRSLNLICPDILCVNWCEKYISRAVENLLSNAIKYGYADTPIELGVAGMTEGMIDLWVKDYGDAMSEVELSKIFNPYSRLRPENHTKEGWGIGLSLVKAIVEGHSGKLEVTSQQKEGTYFHMLLPIEPKII
jgi:K+-sensing histidine kinase KdpD